MRRLAILLLTTVRFGVAHERWIIGIIVAVTLLTGMWNVVAAHTVSWIRMQRVEESYELVEDAIDEAYVVLDERIAETESRALRYPAATRKEDQKVELQRLESLRETLDAVNQVQQIVAQQHVDASYDGDDR